MVFAVEFPIGYGFYVSRDRILIGYVFENTLSLESHSSGRVYVYVPMLVQVYPWYSLALKNELSLAIYQL